MNERQLLCRRALVIPLVVGTLLAATGCPVSEWIAHYDVVPAGLARVDGESAEGDLQTAGEPGKRSRVRLERPEVAVVVGFESASIHLTVENRSEEPLEILWSKAKLAGDFTAPLILGNSGSKEERSLPQQPTSLAPGESDYYQLILGPPGRWQPFSDEKTRGFWQRSRSLFDLEVDAAPRAEERQRLMQQSVGLEFRLVLPLQMGEDRRDLVLPLRVTGAELRAVYY